MRRAAVAFVLALTACNGNAGGSKADPLPPIAIDACPAPETLLAPAEEPRSGKRLPDVTLACLGHAGEVRMRALGKVPTVVNLWASWCHPCRTEMPEFQKVHADLGDKVRFLGVDTNDHERQARGAIQNAAITYANVVDKDRRIQLGVGSRAMPTTLLVGADGLIKNMHVGELTGPQLRDLISKHLGVTA